MARPKKAENKEKTIKLEDVVLDNALKSIEKEYGKGMIMNIGETFIRALKSQKEMSIVAGIGFRW